ncbi:p1/s1 nuclease, putative [Plasmodium ovale]|uniref:p1/s1 nuclease, putative n=2 Tax=Plasmodium ovale TaxID=36330 RepID=A0A1A8WXM7_PLAOA|nr:p1/s1 nuclease, putative [Plasmodium ovale curtisi]SBS97721.1 p1/s1 nuclease, putative [Plasmodium ovale curtisi]SCP06292.1 p1/s1 nuclease, putative [Plasmodium ovale]
MNNYIICCIYGILIFVKRIECWSDEGHMVVSAIAYEGLNDEEKLVLNHIFKNYKEDNDFNDPISGAVWSDHIKSVDYHYPDKVRRVDGVDLMNKWHYINVPYNPTNANINIFHEQFYKKTDNALTILKHIFTSLKSIKKKENHGTFFSYNFNLRYFIHIFGDIHQPLHVITFFNKHYPDGDSGGTNIYVMYNKKVEKLHYLCDCVFHTRNKKWPYTTTNQILNEAKKLINMYPPEYFGNRLKNELNENEYLDFIISDSYNKAVDCIYSNFPHDTLNKDTSYLITNFAIINLKKTLNEQIVLAGYRLAHYLKIMIANVPGDLVPNNNRPS